MSNLHVNLDEANKHDPKGFIPAPNNTYPVKDERGLSYYEERMSLPKAINFVDGTAAPPTTADFDVYVLTGSGTEDAGWGTAVFGDWVRFFNGIPTPITPLAGYRCFDETSGTWKEYNGSNWVAGDANTTNLSIGTITATTVDINSDTGTDATIPSATASDAGLMSAAKFNEVVANNAKVTNATHTGEVTGSGALTVDKTVISNKTLVTADGADHVLIGDASDADNLKKVLVSDFLGGGSSGSVGISDGSGSYTYYATLAAAITASSVGDSIQLFSNLTVGAATALKAGTTLNGNGYEINITANDDILTALTAGNFWINDVKLTGLGKGINVGGTAKVYCNEGVFVDTSQDAARVASGGLLSGGRYNRPSINNVITNTGGTLIDIYATGAYGIRSVGGTLERCFSNGSLVGMDLNSGAVAHGCTGVANSGFGIYSNNAKVFDSSGISNTSQGCYGEALAEWNNCTAYSTASTAWGGAAASNFQQINNCTSRSAVTRSFSGDANIKGGVFISNISRGLVLNDGSIDGAFVENILNATNGDAMWANADNLLVTNCTFKVANASANCIYANSAFNLYYAHNGYKGATVPVNALLTQAIVANEDTKGNIIII